MRCPEVFSVLCRCKRKPLRMRGLLLPMKLRHRKVKLKSRLRAKGRRAAGLRPCPQEMRQLAVGHRRRLLRRSLFAMTEQASTKLLAQTDIFKCQYGNSQTLPLPLNQLANLWSML